MPRPVAVLPVLASLLAVAPAAPVPKENPQDGPLYFPTTVWTKWVYEEGGRESVEFVEKVDERRGAKVVSVGLDVGNRVRLAPTRDVMMSPQGLFLLREHGETFDPPWCLLKLPLKAGEKWEANARGPRSVRAAVMTAFGPEQVEVPAGKYDAVRVESEETVNGKPHRLTRWYARGVGLVKEAEGDRVKVLKSFTPGKD